MIAETPAPAAIMEMINAMMATSETGMTARCPFIFSKPPLRNPPISRTVVVDNCATTRVAVVRCRACPVKIVVDYEVARGQVYPYAGALLVCSIATPDSVPLDVVVVGFYVTNIDAVVCVVAILGVANYRISTDGVAARVVKVDTMAAVSLKGVSGDRVVARVVQADAVEVITLADVAHD